MVGAVILFVMVLLSTCSPSGSTRRCATCCEQLDLWWIHFQNGFMRGVLNLKDVVYYLAVTYFFLLLAVKTLEAKRWQ